MRLTLQQLVRAAVIASVYVIISYILLPLSFGIVQFRAAEALTVLPILYPEAIPGVFIGCLLSNIIGGLGLWDIFGGSTVTLLAALVTYYYRGSFVAYLSPIILNGLLVSLYLSQIFGAPYWITAAGIAASEAGVVFLLGIPLVHYLRRRYFADAGKRPQE
ncbi:MAG: QueT transporter family protein [bacterium]|jgi:uncharacterized membrane protein